MFVCQFIIYINIMHVFQCVRGFARGRKLSLGDPRVPPLLYQTLTCIYIYAHNVRRVNVLLGYAKTKFLFPIPKCHVFSEPDTYVTEHGKRAQLTWSIIFYFFTLLEPALHYLTMDT